VAFTISAVLFGAGALVALLLIPSRRRIEEQRSAILAADSRAALQSEADASLAAASSTPTVIDAS
jgi:hypothetical protein